MGGFNFINIGGSELIFILIIAGIFLGPQRIRDVAKWVGRLTVKARTISRQFTQQLEAELDDEEREALRGALGDLKSLRQEVDDLRKEVLRGPQAIVDGSNETVADMKNEIMRLQKQVDASVKPDRAGQNGTENRIGGTMALPNVVDVVDDPAV